MNSRDKSILDKIVRYCNEIEATHQYFHDDKSLFCDEQQGFIYRNAVTMAILQIGELAKKLSDEYRASHTDVPWKLVIRTRDVYAHHYGSVEYDLVWDTAHEGISELKQALS